MFLLGKIRNAYLFLEGLTFDKRAQLPELPRPKFFDHENGVKWILENFDKENLTILEIGAKEVTGSSVIKSRIINAKYIGTDIAPGRNVDFVCDAHELSKFISNNSVDLIYSTSVFEHLYAPWLVAEEISKVLKVGGFVCIETAFNFKSHERPWNFFHMTDLGLKALFNEYLGFETIDSGLDVPIRGRFSLLGPKYLRMKEVYGLMSMSYFVGKKKSEMKKDGNEDKFNWKNANPFLVDESNNYPSVGDNLGEREYFK